MVDLTYLTVLLLLAGCLTEIGGKNQQQYRLNRSHFDNDTSEGPLCRSSKSYAYLLERNYSRAQLDSSASHAANFNSTAEPKLIRVYWKCPKGYRCNQSSCYKKSGSSINWGPVIIGFAVMFIIISNAKKKERAGGSKRQKCVVTPPTSGRTTYHSSETGPTSPTQGQTTTVSLVPMATTQAYPNTVSMAEQGLHCGQPGTVYSNLETDYGVQLAPPDYDELAPPDYDEIMKTSYATKY